MELRIHCERQVQVPRFRIQIIKLPGLGLATIVAPSTFPPEKTTPVVGTNITYSPEGFTPKGRTLPMSIQRALETRWSDIVPLVEPNVRLGTFSAVIDVRIV